MKRRTCMQDGLFGLFDENLMLNILEKLHDRVDRQAWCLVCKRFLDLEAISKKKIQLLRVEVLREVLSRYTKVEELDLSFCLEVNDEALEMVGHLSGRHLRSVSLAHISQFSDAGLFKLFKQCSSLRKLDLSFCSEITDLGMQAVAELKELESLKLVKCRSITDTGLSYIAAGCKTLRHLYLRRCLGITDSGISVIAENCEKLESLDLSYTNVTAQGLKSITVLQSLKNLILVSCNSVDDTGLACLKHCSKSLLVLDMTRCLQFSERGIMELTSDPLCLEQLTLPSWIPISKGLLASFEKLECLQVIRLNGCEIEEDGLTFIGRGCKSLKEFSVSKCTGLTDNGIRAVVQQCCELHTLDLTCCRELTDLTIACIARSCRGLLSLKMEACSLVTQKGFAFLGQGCIRLEQLDLTDCSIDDEGLKSIARCTALRTLKLGYCLDISDTGIAYIGANCSGLQEMDLYRSLQVSDCSVAAIVIGCPELRILNLSYCTRITDASLHAISRLRDLTQLEIRGCLLVTSAGLSSVGVGCKRLLELDIKRCTNIDDAGLISIAKGCSNLRQVNLSYCQITDVGLLAISRLSCMQNMKLLNLGRVTVDGLADALSSCGCLKKVKLVQPMLRLLAVDIIRKVKDRGCRFRWLDKPELMARVELKPA